MWTQQVFNEIPKFEPIPTMFQGVGDLLMFHGMIVIGLLVFCWATKELVKEIYEYVTFKIRTSSK